MDEVSSSIKVAVLAFTNLEDLWSRHDILLLIKGRVYTTAERYVLVSGLKTWLFRAEEVRIPMPSQHQQSTVEECH